jgi:flagellar motility protein MotE (MotC chaperone)
MIPNIKIRLLPALIAAGVLTIGLRGADVVSRLVDGSGIQPVRAAQAETPKPEAAASAQPPATPASGAAQGTPAQQAAADKHATPETNISPAEMDLLQSLQKRREELDQRDAAIQQREATLKVAEGRVDQKLAELSSLKAGIENLLELQKKKQDDEVMSLVKIYSAMKGPDAARIFNTLDMPVLLSVVSHMKEQKSASIIAAMEPDRARELTARLADLRQLPDGASVDSGSAGSPTALTPTAAKAAAQGAAQTPPAVAPQAAAPSAAPAAKSPQSDATAPAKPAGQPAAKPAG